MLSHAKSGDVDFIQLIENASFSGFVHSAFDKTVNIQCLDGGELYTIACSKLDNGPHTLVVDVNGFNEMAIAVHDVVYVEEKVLYVGHEMAITIDHVEKWESVLPNFPADLEILKMNVRKMKQYIDIHGKDGGMKKSSLAKNSFEDEMSKMLTERSGKLRDELLHNRMSDALQHAVGLIGLGPGLTPSGDDFLVGLLTISNMRNTPCSLPTYFFEEIAHAAKIATNEISYMMVKKAAVGKVRESIICLLHSLLDGTQEELILSLDKVVSIGSSSGTDIALGLICGLELNIEAGGKGCLPKL